MLVRGLGHFCVEFACWLYVSISCQPWNELVTFHGCIPYSPDEVVGNKRLDIGKNEFCVNDQLISLSGSDRTTWTHRSDQRQMRS